MIGYIIVDIIKLTNEYLKIHWIQRQLKTKRILLESKGSTAPRTINRNQTSPQTIARAIVLGQTIATVQTIVPADHSEEDARKSTQQLQPGSIID